MLIYLNISPIFISPSWTNFPPKANAAAFANIIIELDSPNVKPKTFALRDDFLENKNMHINQLQDPNSISNKGLKYASASTHYKQLVISSSNADMVLFLGLSKKQSNRKIQIKEETGISRKAPMPLIQIFNNLIASVICRYLWFVYRYIDLNTMSIAIAKISNIFYM